MKYENRNLYRNTVVNARNLYRNTVANAGDATAYLTDCTLATVEDLAWKKSISKSEFTRQINIAQMGIDWMVEFGVAPAGRAVEILNEHSGSVVEWANLMRAKYVK